MQEIAEGVVVETGLRRITVGAIATGKGIVCVDVPPFPDQARAWRYGLEQHFGQPIRLLILTDAHRDRLLGAYWYGDVHIIAHDATARAIRALPGTFVDQAADALAMNSEERAAFAGVRLRMPRVTFSERMMAYVEEVGIPLLAMPGPTPGNVWVHLADRRVVFTGDSVVVGQPLQMTQAQSKPWLSSLTQLRRPRFAADVIVPGRGPVTDKAATQPISEYLRYARRRVQRLYRAGRPRADVANLVPRFMEQFPIPPGETEEVQRRVRAGLESIYDEFRRGEATEDDED